MKSFRLLSLTLFLLSSFLVQSETQCPANVASVRLHSLAHSHIGVPATINGSGPFEFLVDTGAQITVVEPLLARELNLPAAGSLEVITVLSHVDVPLVSATVLEVGRTSVRGVHMAVEDLGSIQAENPGVRGILGNNFLSRFDLLIDNSRKMVCFDDSRQIQQVIRGERVPIVSSTGSPSDSASAEAILVSAHLPDDGRKVSILRLDSGSNVPLLYADAQVRAMSFANVSRAMSIGKRAQFAYVYTPPRTARFGPHTEMQIAFAGQIGSSRLYSKTGEDGVLPTALFHRIFISVADHFVIFDPR